MKSGVIWFLLMVAAFVLTMVVVGNSAAKERPFMLYEIHCYGDGKLLYVNRTVTSWYAEGNALVVTEDSGKKHRFYNMACMISPFKRNRGAGE